MGKDFRRTGLFVGIAIAVVAVASLLFNPLGGGPTDEDGARAGEEFNWQATGPDLFARACAACHQPEGEGIEGIWPAFQGNPFVLLDDPTLFIQTVLNGRGGMPSFNELLMNEEIAAILSYIRNSWGNEASPVTPADVAEVRGGERHETDPQSNRQNRPGTSD